MMGDSVCMLRSLSHPSGSSRDSYEVDPIRALRESVSFGKYVSESLDWERWSSFKQNRHLEEAKRFSKPGSVAQKKAYFDAVKAKKTRALLETENAEIEVSISNGSIRCDIDSANPRLRSDNGLEKETKPCVNHEEISEHSEESSEFNLQVKGVRLPKALVSPSKPAMPSSNLQSPLNLRIQFPQIKEDNGMRSSSMHVKEPVDKSGNPLVHENSMKISSPLQIHSQDTMNGVFKHSSISTQSENISSQSKACVAYERASPIRNRMGERVAKFKEFFESIEQRIKREAAKMQLQTKPKAIEKAKNGFQKQRQIIASKSKPLTPSNHTNKFQFMRPQSPIFGRKVTPIVVPDPSSKLPREPSFAQENVSPNILLSF